MKPLILFSILFLLRNGIVFSQGNIEAPISTDYETSIAGKSSGSISAGEIINAKELVLSKEAKSKYHISSFKMTIACKGENIREFENSKSGKLTDQMIEALKKVTPGCKIFLEYIKSVDKTNGIDHVINLKPLQFVIE